MTRWTILILPALLHDAPPRLRVYLDQRTPAATARKAIRVASESGIPFVAMIVVRDLETLDRDVLSWKGVDLSSLRIADRDALGELGACSDRLPCFILQKGAVRHLAHGVPTDLNLKEMDRCTRR
jgi:hypothetical protein